MTSIGRLRVVRSIGLPHRRQAMLIGDEAGARVGPSGGGGGVPRAIRGPPPIERRQRTRTAIRRMTTRTPRSAATTGTPPTSADQNPFSAPTWTVWNPEAPVFSSFAATRRSPVLTPAGIARYRSAPGNVLIADAEVTPNRLIVKRNWDGRLAVPRADTVRCAWIVSPGRYEVLSRLMLRRYAPAGKIVRLPDANRPACDAVTVNVYPRLDGFGVVKEK